MTLDHAALTAIWTAYIFLGSNLKDRRLTHFIGQPYQQYAQRVPAYPLVGSFWRFVRQRGRTDGLGGGADAADASEGEGEGDAGRRPRVAA